MNIDMNFSLGCEFKELCNQIMTAPDTRINELTDIIRHKIDRINKHKNGIWGQPSGDQTALELFNRLLSIVQYKNDELQTAAKRLRAEAVARTSKYLKVVFIANEPSVWPSANSLYHAMENDDRFHVKAVYVKTPHENKKEKSLDDIKETYQVRYGTNIINEDEYDMASDNPDFVLYLKPYDGPFNINNKFNHNPVMSTGARIIYISYGMETTRTFLNYNFQLPLLYHAWKHIAYGPIVKKCAAKYGYKGGENVVVWGHPKADGISNSELHKNDIPKEWIEKINGRKAFLWNTHHTILAGGMSTWLQHGKAVLDYFREHDDVVLLWRPHPLLFGSLVNNGYMTEDELDAFTEEVTSHNNIILDTSEDYRPAFWASDAAITDGTGFFGEYIYTDKPMIVTTNNPYLLWLWREIDKAIPVATETGGLYEFIDMVRNGQDIYKEARLKFRKAQYFLPESSTVGEYIRDNIYAELVKELAPTCMARKSEAETDKLVTACILSYQNTELLERSIFSVLNQDWSRIELIIADDCSDCFDEDRIRTFIEQNRKSNLEGYVIVRQEKNVGTVRNLRSAVGKMHGDYYITLGADDALYDNGAITAYMVAAREMDHKPYMITGLLAMTEEKDLEKVLNVFPYEQEDRDMLLRGNARELYGRNAHWSLIAPVSTCYRKEILEDYGNYDTDYTYLEDWPLACKTLRDDKPPLFINRFTARHAMGGIANGNVRYKNDVRRNFVIDKANMFDKEVISNIEILTPAEVKKLIERIKWEKKVFDNEIGVAAGQVNPFDLLLKKLGEL